MLTVVLKPFYLPREFTKVTVNVVYVHPKANTIAAMSTVTNHVHEQQNQSPRWSYTCYRGLYTANLRDYLPKYELYVDMPTRGNRTLDLCYGNVPGVYKTKRLPQLGNSDHCMVSLLPKYRFKLKTLKVHKKCVTIWNENACESLKGCFASTDWFVSINACDNIDDLVDTVSSYINFCVDTVTEKKEVKCYPNNKPWVSKELKALLNEKKKAFKSKIKEKSDRKQKQIVSCIKNVKEEYKQKLKQNFTSNNLRTTWKSIKNIVCYTPKEAELYSADANSYVNKLNKFFGRFDTHDFSTFVAELKHNVLTDVAEDETVTVTTDDVRVVFSGLKVNKVSGPDKIS
ncbi:Pol-like protein [Elysia marginata]|uniref:Pol-like protein n=1 Tax=Elysia marginata TaxID=1093978 RepID=A0AAV4H5B4_9GAST|nr:Pol-like protein [Elysia marginata]